MARGICLKTCGAIGFFAIGSISTMTWLLLAQDNPIHPFLGSDGTSMWFEAFHNAPPPQKTASSVSVRRSMQANELPPDLLVRKESASSAVSVLPVAPEPEPFECTPRPQWAQNKVEKREGKQLIYFHEGPPIKNVEKLHELYVIDNPNKDTSCLKCGWTVDEKRLPEADIVVVMYRRQHDYNSNGMVRVPTKYCGQIFVMLQQECPNNIDVNTSPEQKFQDTRMFDVSSTYRLDSDLPRPYVMDVKMMMRLAKENYVPAKKRDSKNPVGWIASRCETTNDRYGYVEELMKHIGVKSYGKCLNNAKMDVTRHEKNWKAAADAQVGRHKFYLAFENSNCDYYVTEKYFRTIQTGVIPIIMGAPQAHLYVPNNHSAIFVRDYPNPADLAKKLHEINNNDTLFESYLNYLFDPNEIDVEFKNRWLKRRPHQICQLCDLGRSTFHENLKGVPYEFWNACEERHGTWRTNFQPMPRESIKKKQQNNTQSAPTLMRKM